MTPDTNNERSDLLGELGFFLEERAMRGVAQAAPAEPDMRAVALAAGDYTTAYSMMLHAEVHNADVDGSTKRLVAAINDLRSALGQPAPVAEDAANWHWLASYLVGPRTDLDDEIVASESVNDLRKLVSAARAPTAPPAQEARVPLNVDALAQEIRRVDGNHSLGAGALAEALLPWITAAQKETP